MPAKNELEQRHKPRRSLSYLVHVLSSSLSRRSLRLYVEKYDISVPGLRVLSTLDRDGMMASRDIAVTTAMDKGMVSRVVAELKRKGLVEVHSADKHTRLRRWTLTKRGRDFVDEMRPLWRNREARIQEGLTAQEQKLLVELLERVLQGSEALRLEEARRHADGQDPLMLTPARDRPKKSAQAR